MEIDGAVRVNDTFAVENEILVRRGAFQFVNLRGLAADLERRARLALQLQLRRRRRRRLLGIAVGFCAASSAAPRDERRGNKSRH